MPLLRSEISGAVAVSQDVRVRRVRVDRQSQMARAVSTSGLVAADLGFGRIHSVTRPRILILMSVLLAGCAATQNPDREVIVREVSAAVAGQHQTGIIGGEGEGEGCRLSQIGETTDCFIWRGERCTVVAGECPGMRGKR